MKNKKILVVVGGPKHKLDPFLEAGKNLGIDVVTASFSQINYESKGKFVLKVDDIDIAEFDVIYIRMIGKRLEDATLLVSYAKEKGIRLVDRFFETADMMPLSLGKSIETKKLIEWGVSLPKTYFASIKKIRENAEEKIGFPYLIKSTTGKKAREVWLPKTKSELEELLGDLEKQERKGMRFFATEFVKSSQRIRVFVLGGRIIGAITRPTKWRKRFIKKVGGEFPEGEKKSLNIIPRDVSEISIQAANALGVDIAGVDILKEDKSGKLYVIEVNAAPAWKLVANDTGLNIEEEILKYLLD